MPLANHYHREMLLVALIIFLGLTVHAHTGLDRWIYGAITAVIVGAFVYYRQVPSVSGWFWN